MSQEQIAVGALACVSLFLAVAVAVIASKRDILRRERDEARKNFGEAREEARIATGRLRDAATERESMRRDLAAVAAIAAKHAPTTVTFGGGTHLRMDPKP